MELVQTIVAMVILVSTYGALVFVGIWLVIEGYETRKLRDKLFEELTLEEQSAISKYLNTRYYLFKKKNK